MLNSDYKDILQNLLKSKVKFLVVGAYAMAVYGYPRATGDFDIWVDPTLENSSKVCQALVDFGAPLRDTSYGTFSQKGIIFQIGVAPRRIDLITEIDGVSFSVAYPKRRIVNIEGIHVPFLSMEDLIRNKMASGRDKDKLDLKELKRLKKSQDK